MNTRSADRLLLCLCWAVYLGMVISSGGLGSFIAAWQHSLIVVAAVVFVVLMALSWWGRAAVAHEHHQHAGRAPLDQVIQTLVHCLPLFLIAGLGVTALGGQAFATSGFRAPAIPTTPSTAPPIVLGEYTIADVYAGNRPAPVPVTLIGMAYAPSDEDYSRLPGSMTREQVPLLLYRYQIICCAADATPLFVGILGVDRTRFANDSWIRVTGTLDAPVAPANVGILHVTTVEAVPEPAEPYLKRTF